MPNEDLRQMQINLDHLLSGKRDDYMGWLLGGGASLAGAFLRTYWPAAIIAFAFITYRPMLVYMHTAFRQYRFLQGQIKAGKVSPSTAIIFNFAYQYRELPEAKLDRWTSLIMTFVGLFSVAAVVSHGIARIDWTGKEMYEAFTGFYLLLAAYPAFAYLKYRESELQTQKEKMTKLNEIMARIRGDQAHAMGTEK